MAKIKNFILIISLFIHVTHAFAQDSPISLPPGEEEIIVWAIEAVKQTMTYDYQNYEERMKQNSSYFTERGWTAYSEAFNKAQIKETVVEDKLHLMTYKSEAENAAVCNKEEKEGVYIWSVVVPIKTIYSSTTDNKTTTQHVLVFINETFEVENKTTKKAIDRWMGSFLHVNEPCQWYELVKAFDKHKKKYMEVIEE